MYISGEPLPYSLNDSLLALEIRVLEIIPEEIYNAWKIGIQFPVDSRIETSRTKFSKEGRM